jgi:hypothetical protein
MTEATPPPEEPLGDQARARIRADLVAVAQDGSRGWHGWTTAIAGAAAVVLISALGAWTLSSDGEDPVADAPSERQSEPSASPSTSLSPAPLNAVPRPESCQPVVDHQLPGAHLALEVPDDDEDGSTSFWVEDDEFLSCDVRNGVVGVRGPLPLEPDLDDKTTFYVLTTAPLKGLLDPSVGMAGGSVPTGALAYDLVYEFPDGQTEGARQTTDAEGRTWWWLVHRSAADPEAADGPVVVTLSLSGVQRTYQVPWGPKR